MKNVKLFLLTLIVSLSLFGCTGSKNDSKDIDTNHHKNGDDSESIYQNKIDDIDSSSYNDTDTFTHQDEESTSTITENLPIIFPLQKSYYLPYKIDGEPQEAENLIFVVHSSSVSWQWSMNGCDIFESSEGKVEITENASMVTLLPKDGETSFTFGVGGNVVKVELIPTSSTASEIEATVFFGHLYVSQKETAGTDYTFLKWKAGKLCPVCVNYNQVSISNYLCDEQNLQKRC